MKIKSNFFLIIFFLLSFDSIGRVTGNIKKTKQQRVSEAYGYFSGQEYSLEIIQKAFPPLEPEIVKAQLSFESTFGKSKKNISKYLLDLLGEKEFNNYRSESLTFFKKKFDTLTYTKEDEALDFIEEVKNRAKGQIESPILETLLYFQYLDNPQEEFLQGFTKSFKTKGHSKSKNTDWQIKVPISWKSEEADRPNIIQKFISDYGDGNQNIMLMVNEMPLPEGYKITKEELNNFFTEKEIKIMVPEGAKFILFKKMTLDNNIGGMLETEQIKEILDFKMKIRIVQFMFIRGNKIYFLQCSTSSLKLDADLTLEMQKYLTLYKLVASTIVVNNQYK